MFPSENLNGVVSGSNHSNNSILDSAMVQYLSSQRASKQLLAGISPVWNKYCMQVKGLRCVKLSIVLMGKRKFYHVQFSRDAGQH